jgi:hypothetical protein
VKRFRRWLFNGVAALSLVLSLATCVFWVRGYRYAESFFYNAFHVSDIHEKHYFVTSVRGTAAIGYGQVTYFTLQFATNDARRWAGFHCWSIPSAQRITLDYSLLHQMGFACFHLQGNTLQATNSSNTVTLPDWFIALLFLILPSMAIVRIFRRRILARQGHCAICGYDMRATPDRCPECGTIPPKKRETISN